MRHDLWREIPTRNDADTVTGSDKLFNDATAQIASAADNEDVQLLNLFLTDRRPTTDDGRRTTDDGRDGNSVER